MINSIRTAGALVKEILDLSGFSDNLSVDFSSSLASVVSCPAAECCVHLAVQFANVFYVEILDCIGFWIANEAVFFVAVLASFRVPCSFEEFIHSRGEALCVAFAAYRSENSLKIG